MADRDQERRASQIRSNIKAAVAQLDSWTTNQRELRARRNHAIAERGGGRQGRERYAIDAQVLARASQGTQLVRDPPCDICGLASHLSDECDRIAVVASSETVFENPSTGIHRGIVHTVYSQAADLYRLLYPRFYPGPDEEVVPTQIAYLLPVPLTGPDYQQIAISRAVLFLLHSPHLRPFSSSRSGSNLLGLIRLRSPSIAPPSLWTTTPSGTRSIAVGRTQRLRTTNRVRESETVAQSRPAL